jgi:hypothetical protein
LPRTVLRRIIGGNGIAKTYVVVLAACAAVAVSLAAASSAGAHDCQCRFAGQKYHQGTTVCMRGKVAECGMVLNNSSWNIVAETCPQVRAPQPQQLFTSLASPPRRR